MIVNVTESKQLQWLEAFEWQEYLNTRHLFEWVHELLEQQVFDKCTHLKIGKQAADEEASDWDEQMMQMRHGMIQQAAPD